MRLPAARLIQIRETAAERASRFFPEGVAVDTADLWRLTRFFEQVAIHGTDAVRAEFGPKTAPVAVLGLVS